MGGGLLQWILSPLSGTLHNNNFITGLVLYSTADISGVGLQANHTRLEQRIFPTLPVASAAQPPSLVQALFTALSYPSIPRMPLALTCYLEQQQQQQQQEEEREEAEQQQEGQ